MLFDGVGPEPVTVGRSAGVAYRRDPDAVQGDEGRHG